MYEPAIFSLSTHFTTHHAPAGRYKHIFEAASLGFDCPET
jgi:hypothetical protein